MFVYRVFDICVCCTRFFFFQAEDGIRDLVRSRGLGDVYKRQDLLIAYHHASQPLQINPERYEMLSLGSDTLAPYALSLIHI